MYSIYIYILFVLTEWIAGWSENRERKKGKKDRSIGNVSHIQTSKQRMENDRYCVENFRENQ